MVRFGSCTELYVPLHTDIIVKEGEMTKGIEVVIGRRK